MAPEASVDTEVLTCSERAWRCKVLTQAFGGTRRSGAVLDCWRPNGHATAPRHTMSHRDEAK
eukprot:2590779-Rhodomonas_salina.1